MLENSFIRVLLGDPEPTKFFTELSIKLARCMVCLTQKRAQKESASYKQS